MKSLLLTMLLLPSLVLAGGEVPWPINTQQTIQVRDLEGLWMSVNIKDPRMMYYFYFDENGGTKKCPTRLHVVEIKAGTNVVVTHGSGLHCKNSKSISFVMYDGKDQARFVVELVGLKKTATKADSLGVQWLGLSLFNYGDKERIAVDIFQKISTEKDL